MRWGKHRGPAVSSTSQWSSDESASLPLPQFPHQKTRRSLTTCSASLMAKEQMGMCPTSSLWSPCKVMSSCDGTDPEKGRSMFLHWQPHKHPRR